MTVECGLVGGGFLFASFDVAWQLGLEVVTIAPLDIFLLQTKPNRIKNGGNGKENSEPKVPCAELGGGDEGC
jgi:hypothetical protein